MDQMTDQRIERSVELAAPVSRVWRALTDHREFGTWFRARIDAPFVAGETSRGHITYPGYEHLRWEARIRRIEPERYFAFTWPHTGDGGFPAEGAPTTLVEFHLEPTPRGSRLTVVESGFEHLPEPMRSTQLRENTGGWNEQMENIRRYLADGA